MFGGYPERIGRTGEFQEVQREVNSQRVAELQQFLLHCITVTVLLLVGLIYKNTNPYACTMCSAGASHFSTHKTMSY